MRLHTLLLCALLVAGCFRPVPQTTPTPPVTRPAETKPAATQPQTTVKATEPEEKDPFRAKVLAALKLCVDDPDGLEIIALGKPMRNGQNDETSVRFRAKTPAGGKKLSEWTCQSSNGSVIRFWEMDKGGNVRNIDVPK